jgi:hypothetical protein
MNKGRCTVLTRSAMLATWIASCMTSRRVSPGRLSNWTSNGVIRRQLTALCCYRDCLTRKKIKSVLFAFWFKILLNNLLLLRICYWLICNCEFLFASMKLPYVLILRIIQKTLKWHFWHVCRKPIGTHKNLRICDLLINHKKSAELAHIRDFRFWDSGRIPRICGPPLQIKLRGLSNEHPSRETVPVRGGHLNSIQLTIALSRTRAASMNLGTYRTSRLSRVALLLLSSPRWTMDSPACRLVRS